MESRRNTYFENGPILVHGKLLLCPWNVSVLVPPDLLGTSLCQRDCKVQHLFVFCWVGFSVDSGRVHFGRYRGNLTFVGVDTLGAGEVRPCSGSEGSRRRRGGSQGRC